MRTNRTQPKRARNYIYLIYLVIIFAVGQFFALRFFYKELETNIPENLFASTNIFPQSELTLNYADREIDMPVKETEETALMAEEPIAQESTEDIQPEIDTTMESFGLSDLQKQITLRALQLLEEDLAYGYELYPDEGYPQGDKIISTDIISLTLRDCGYDLMELIYEDMSENTGSYPMDIVDRTEPSKHIDFRHVFFQQTFFSRHALELETRYDPSYENNNLQWQPGDIVFFQFDEDEPHQNMAGIISSHASEQGIPLVIMISSELDKVSEVDVLTEYDIAGHYRYPYPEDLE